MEAICIISRFETAGDGAHFLKKSLDFLKNLINNSPQELEEMADSMLEENVKNKLIEEKLAVESKTKTKGFLHNWATSIKRNVDQILKKEKGDDLNPRHCPRVETRLMKLIYTIPVWSCIRRDDFGYGRVPASSAPVEAEIKTLKQQIKKKQERLDVAVENIVNYYKGKLKLIDCSNKSENNKSENVHRESAEAAELNNSICLSKDSEVEDEVAQKQSCSKDISIESTKQNFCDRSPLKDLSSSYNSNVNTACLACANGDFPTGSHICLICKKNFHILDGCSIRIEGKDEGHGERRLCIECDSSSTKDTQIGLNNIENWRNLGRPKKQKKQPLYLGKTNQNLDDLLTSTNLRSLAILKYGEKIA
ncbi:uncharacterized protein LOC122502153 [Leptopilina heterotoma]|uniref:uncharacterized protein LOC122502153 n=1 Tax=Leptopilina heterotoma TaxID=63436 RepID=UPI001CA8CECF|nr:uncharacterized protein LOC122502153 [Leptopilina heterotoma]